MPIYKICRVQEPVAHMWTCSIFLHVRTNTASFCLMGIIPQVSFVGKRRNLQHVRIFTEKLQFWHSNPSKQWRSSPGWKVGSAVFSQEINIKIPIFTICIGERDKIGKYCCNELSLVYVLWCCPYFSVFISCFLKHGWIRAVTLSYFLLCLQDRKWGKISLLGYWQKKIKNNHFLLIPKKGIAYTLWEMETIFCAMSV